MSNDSSFWEKKYQNLRDLFILLLGRTEGWKWELHQREKQSTQFPVSTGDEAHQTALGFFSKRKTLLCQLHLTERGFAGLQGIMHFACICWPAVGWWQVFSPQLPPQQSISKWIIFCYYLWRFCKRPYLGVNSHLWSPHNDKVVLLRVLLLAKNLLLQKSEAISEIIYWTTALGAWSSHLMPVFKYILMYP